MKKGFTLIELLAVIVILALIALISVPMILGIVEKVKKGALGATANGLLESATLYYAKNLNDIGENKVFLFDETHDGETSDNIKLTYKGDFKGTGSVRIYKDGKTAICIQNEKYYAIKNINNTKVTTGTGTCSYDEATNTYLSVNLVSQELVDNLQEQLDQMNAEKQELVDALVSKGVSVNETDDLGTIVDILNNTTIGKQIATLGTETTFDLKTNYATYGLAADTYLTLSSDSFFVTITKSYARFNSGNQLGGGETTTANVVKNYNNTTGILTITGTAISDSYDQTTYGGGANQITTYLIY
ncbi:MAG: type II secretion system protein [Bacilli bacterium]|nr:type II secretion system protein [Bacilli bacterium]